MMPITNPAEFMIQIAESVKLHKLKKDFEFTIKASFYTDSGGIKTHIIYSVVVFDDIGTLVTKEWSMPVSNLFNSPVNNFINILPGSDLMDLANMIVEDPQKFLDELTVFMVHES